MAQPPLIKNESVVRGATWAAAARVIGAAAFGANNMLLARLLGADEFGYFAVATSSAVFAGLLATGGFNRSLLREIATTTGTGDYRRLLNRHRLATKILQITIPSIALLGGVFTVVIIDNSRYSGVVMAFAISLLIAVNGFQSLVSDLLRAFGDVRLSSFLQGRSGGALVFLIHTILLIPFFLTPLSLQTALLLNVVAYLTVLIPAWKRTAREWRIVAFNAGPTRPTPTRDPPFVQSSVTFMGTQLVLLLATQLDLWIAAISLRPAELSMFAAATRLLVLISMPLVAVEFALAPSVARLYAVGEIDTLKSTVRSAAAVVAVPTILLVSVVFTLPSGLLKTFFGDAFSGGSAALVWLSIGQAVGGFIGLSGTILAMTGGERQVLLSAGALAGMKAGIATPLALKYGMIPLAIVSGISLALFYILQTFMAYKRMNIWSLPSPSALSRRLSRRGSVRRR